MLDCCSDPEQVGLIKCAAGLACTLLLGLGTKALLERVDRSTTWFPPHGIKLEDWKAATREGGPNSALLGLLERVLFFAAFTLNAHELAGGWLVFKVGTKWEVWANVIKVPEHFGQHGAKPGEPEMLEGLRARQIWGSWLLQRFLVGTLANIIFAGAGVGVSRWLEARF